MGEPHSASASTRPPDAAQPQPTPPPDSPALAESREGLIAELLFAARGLADNYLVVSAGGSLFCLDCSAIGPEGVLTHRAGCQVARVCDLLARICAAPESPKPANLSGLAIHHLLFRIHGDPRLAYYFDPLTRSMEELTAAYAEWRNLDLATFRARFYAGMRFEVPHCPDCEGVTL